MATSSDMPKKAGHFVRQVAKYQSPLNWRSIWQIINSFVPFFVIWVLMYFSLSISYWLTLGLALFAAGFLTRIFIIQHDCGHQSFFASRRANDFVGMIASVITLTPYEAWRRSHAKHHANSGDLDFRGFGDVDTITVDEYLALDFVGRVKYRAMRNPFVLFVVGPAIMFIILHRIPIKVKKEWKKERRSIAMTNLAIAVVVIAMGLLIGFREFFMIQLPITIISSSLGVWLFYIQHQFEDTYWRRHKEWEYETAALEGSSYYKLPKLLQWFTGNIGFHHIHHLNPKIPNYRLEEAYEENDFLRDATTFTLWTSIKVVFFHLWDEQQQKMVSFWDLPKIRPQSA